MNVTRAFDLAFHAPLRLGGGARDDADAARDFPSDTLSAALVVAAADLFGDTVKGVPLADLARDPPWVVSSLLPWVELGGVRVRFFPRPPGRPLGEGAGKALRRVAYVSSDLLDRPSAKPVLSACRTLAAISDGIHAHAWQRRALRPSVTIDRVSSAANLFHLEEVAVAVTPRDERPTLGAWIAVRARTEADMGLVETLLRYLADSGIGADRARGMGRFSVLDPGPLDEPAGPATMRMLLGYASPDAALLGALEDPVARYSIVRRGGRLQGADGGVGLPPPPHDRMLQRKVLRLLAPGSILPDTGPVVGRTREVTPEGYALHSVFRDGRTLAWPLRGIA